VDVREWLVVVAEGVLDVLAGERNDDLIDVLESYPEMAFVTIILVFDAVIIQYGVVAGVKKFTH